MIRQMNIPISVDLDENAPDFAEKVKAHQSSIDLAANTLDMMLLDGWREIASMPIITPDSQSIQIILFKNTRAQIPPTGLMVPPDLMHVKSILQPTITEAIGKKVDDLKVLGLNGDKS